MYQKVEEQKPLQLAHQYRFSNALKGQEAASRQAKAELRLQHHNLPGGRFRRGTPDGRGGDAASTQTWLIHANYDGQNTLQSGTSGMA